MTLSKSSDASLGPPSAPRKHTLMSQKVTPSGSGCCAKDILDRLTMKYESGMSLQYSKVLVLLTSKKSSEVASLSGKEQSTKGNGDHSYIKLTRSEDKPAKSNNKPTRSDSNSDRKRAEPPSKKAKCDASCGPTGADAGSSSSKKKTKKSSKRAPKSKKTVWMDLDDSKESKDLCGKLHSQPTKDEVSKC